MSRTANAVLGIFIKKVIYVKVNEEKMKAIITRLQRECDLYASNGDYKMAKHLNSIIVELLEVLKDE